MNASQRPPAGLYSHADQHRGVVMQCLRAMQRRLALRGALVGAAIGGAVSAVTIGVATSLRDAPTSPGVTVLGALAAMGVGSVVGWWRGRPELIETAEALEQRVPPSRNLLRTAVELQLRDATPATDHGVAALVAARAEALASTIDVPALVPMGRALAAVSGAACAVVLSVMWASGGLRPVTAPARAAVMAIRGEAEIVRVVARVVAPPYARRADSLLTDPTRVSALIGSTVSFTVDASVDTLVVTTGDSTRRVVRANNVLQFTLPVVSDGFVALEAVPSQARGPSTARSARRLIGLSAQRDDAPSVVIVEPQKDLILPSADRTLSIRMNASDDLALRTLRVRYTKVAGSGERFTFSEGEVPVTIQRSSGARWNGQATLALAPLLSEPGDLVVYRAVVTDSRPGSPAVESDALIAELAAPGGLAALGFALDPDEDRYALSQQMVIQKTERLIAQRSRLSAEVALEQSMQLAGEQRRVRAEFVFMMGGEFAEEAVITEDGVMELDEHEEAESEGDLAAGRMVNRGRSALLAAVRAMSRAAVALTTAELQAALAQEKTALTQLQEAFARNRFLMRALSEREQLDMTRRLTGAREGTSRERLPVTAAVLPAQQRALHTLLQDMLAQPSWDGAAAAALGQRVLQIDASAPTAQRIAARLATMGSSGSARGRVARDSIVEAVSRWVASGLRPAASDVAPHALQRMRATLEAARDPAAPRATPRSPQR